jgi:predicted nuclease with TOPRIM domain
MIFGGTSIARLWGMPNDFEQLLKDLFGDSLNRLTQFSSEQTQRLQARFQALAREALKDELTKLHTEINDLHDRVAELEKEKIDEAAETV